MGMSVITRRNRFKFKDEKRLLAFSWASGLIFCGARFTAWGSGLTVSKSLGSSCRGILDVFAAHASGFSTVVRCE